MTNNPQTTRRQVWRGRGVSLIEALVALAVMSLGILAIVGVQANLRFNSDLSRQRVEAARIAAQELEGMRFFTTLAAVPGQLNPSYGDLATRTVVAPLPGNANATYTVTRTAVPSGLGPRHLSIDVTVAWTDRNNVAQTVSLNSVVVAADPVLGALLYVKQGDQAFSQRGNDRHGSVPVEATKFDDNTSGFKPFDRGTVAWLFDNVTGDILKVCTVGTTSQASLTRGDFTCSDLTYKGKLVSGSVRFDLTDPLPSTAAQSPAGPALELASSEPLFIRPIAGTATTSSPVNLYLNPLVFQDWSDCYAMPVADATARGLTAAVPYVCIVYPLDGTGWGGVLDIQSSGTTMTWGTLAGQHKVCRYTQAASDRTRNDDHPLHYCHVSTGTCTERVKQNLTEQNFLVIAATQSCPADTNVVNGATGVLVNYNTRQHQPAP